MYIHTILPTKKSSILLPSNLVQSEMTKKTGIKFSGTIYYCPENPNGYNSFDPKIPGALVGLIQQILLYTNDYILLFESDEIISKKDYHEISGIPGVDRVFIVNIGKSPPQVEKDFQLEAGIFAQYFQKVNLLPKKRWLLSVDVKSEDEIVLKKQKIVDQSSLKMPSSELVSVPSSEVGRRTPSHPSNYWEEKDITKTAWVEKILPNHIEKLPEYTIHGISEIKKIPVPITSKSHMICNYLNGKIYMNQRTKIQKADFKKITDLIASGNGRKVYSFNRVVGYYETDMMVYYHY